LNVRALARLQLCLTMMAHTLATCRHSHIVYIDTNGWFKPSRLLNVLHARYGLSIDDNDVLARVMYARAYDPDDMLLCLPLLLKRCGRQHYALIVVDSIGGALATTVLQPYEQRADGAHTHAHTSCLGAGLAQQRSIASLLRRIAHDYSTAVVCVNNTVAWSGAMRVALGTFWASQIDTRLFLQKFPGGFVHVQLEQRHRQIVSAD
jgi:GTPase Era involved in 16S rRNA processing